MKAELNEQALLKGLANNDSKAVETLYKSHFSSIQHFVLNNNGSFDDARDVFQEAMITLYEKVQSNSFVLTCQIKTYLFSICKHLWLKRLHQLGKYSGPLSSQEETISIDQDIREFDKKEASFEIMHRALNSLGEPCKSLLEGYYLNKKGMQELAADFGYTNADNAKNQKYKCLMRLKKLFFAQYNIGE
ncbi:MAG: sigma-70 family RNA polymerase sigma factor [Sediminibacterium sp.]|nr:MAG: sigma-70 family RNA polymerase sigma factor [Sediminibacterium sp.]